jgi:hypothetical protein
MKELKVQETYRNPSLQSREHATASCGDFRLNN